MARNKRSAAQREGDLERLASLYLRHTRQVDIAKELGVAQSQISYDLKVLQQRWREAALIDFNEAMNRELARIDELEHAYWEAWRRSKEDITKTRSKRREFTNDVPRTIPATGDTPAITVMDKITTVQSESVLEREQRLGDPRYLEGIQWCITARIKIYEMCNPTKGTLAPRGLLNDPDEEGIYRVVTIVKDYGAPEDTEEE